MSVLLLSGTTGILEFILHMCGILLLVQLCLINWISEPDIVLEAVWFSIINKNFIINLSLHIRPV